MNKLISLTIIVLIVFNINVKKTQAQSCKELGWKLAVQTWTFKKFTFKETLENANELGLKYIEGHRGAMLEGAMGTISYAEDKANWKVTKKMLKKNGIKMINFGVVRGSDEAEWIQIFKYAKFMGVETLTIEPKVEMLDIVDKLAQKYKINVAIHNHPKPTTYWDPNFVMKQLEGKSKYMGACADVGHLVRSGLDPIRYLKMYGDKLLAVHFKDLNAKERKAHDVIWGTGISNVKGMLKALKEIGYTGVFTIEYEYNWDNSMPEIKESISNFKQIVSEL